MAKRKLTQEEIQLDNDFSQIAKDIHKVNIKEFLTKNYLPYSWYTILDRALVREDGLKPVQLRLLFMLWLLGAKNKSHTIKASEVYSQVAGQLHPHGSSSVSKAGAKLAQTYNTRVPLIEVQGTVGAYTGDVPAADRYYEIKLSKAGEELLVDVDNHAVEMVDSYSNHVKLPKNLPIKWPVLLINGSQGIAVGYSSVIPPHNPNEVMDAVIGRIKGKINNINQLQKVIKGPDFPTGGEILGKDGINSYFSTGRGTFTIRARYRIEDEGKGVHKIVFYELPYQISAETIIDNIMSVKKKKNKLEEILRVKDLSDMDSGVNLSIYVKAGANPNLVVEDLFKETKLEIKYSVINTTIIDDKPYEANLLELIDNFIRYRYDCITNKLNYQLEKIKKEENRLNGILKIILDLDKAISIIRNSNTDEIAKKDLIKHFKINDTQADYILAMQLRSLTKQNSDNLLASKNKLEEKEKQINLILNDDNEFKNYIINELKETKKVINSERISIIQDITNEELQDVAKLNASRERMLAKDVECRIIQFANNKLTKTLDENFSSETPIVNVIKTTSKGNIQALMKNGNIEDISVESIQLDVPTKTSDIGINEKNMVYLFNGIDENESLVIATNVGNVNRFKNMNKIPIAKLILGEEIVFAQKVDNSKEDELYLNLIARDGQLAKFTVSKIRQSGSGAGTISGMKYNNIVVGGAISNDLDYIITITNETIKVTKSDIIPATSRGVKGSMLHKTKDKEFVKSIIALQKYKAINDNDEEIIIPSETNRAVKGTPYKNSIFVGERDFI